MKLGIHATARMEQGMALTPRMLQSLEVLQLPSADLATVVGEELQRNETLDLAASRSKAGVDDKHAALAAIAADEVDLGAFLRLQMSMLDIAGDVQAAVLELADQLDERGLLTADDQVLSASVGPTLFVAARDVLQRLEPRGIGARTGIEAMLLQLGATDPDLGLIRRLLECHLEDLGHNRLPQVARALRLTLDELETLLGRVARLDPAPLRRLVSARAPCLLPDVTVRLCDGEIQVEVEDPYAIGLSVNEDYRAMAVDARIDASVRRYLGDKLRAASDLMTAIEQRRRTLARVVAVVMRHQRAFLERGPAAIRALAMEQVAERLGLHGSTVSRTVANKSVQTDWGVFGLRSFFDGARGAAADSSAGRSAIQERIRAMVADEEACRPLSDEQIVERLAASGVRVARRTVAKHRTELEIAPSHRRRRYDRT